LPFGQGQPCIEKGSVTLHPSSAILPFQINEFYILQVKRLQEGLSGGRYATNVKLPKVNDRKAKVLCNKKRP
jgi:hypothetical protein